MIIFLASLIAIIVMIVRQYKKITLTGEIHQDFSSKDLSYESFRTIQSKSRRLWLVIIHTVAIVASKAWARITHEITRLFHKFFNKLEERVKKHENRHGSGEAREQSVFLTTMKTYKHEIKKLRGKVEEEAPRARGEGAVVDLLPKDNNIEESK